MIAFIILAVPGVWSIALIAVVVLLIFGGKKIPELMRGLGSGIKEFKEGVKDDDPKTDDPKEIDDKENK